MPRGRPRKCPPDLLQIAYMAGRGYSAARIAYEIGGRMTPERVYSFLSKEGLRLVPKTGRQVAFPVVLERETVRAIEPHADAAGIDSEALAGKLLNEIAEDANLLRSLVTDATFQQPA